MEYTGDIEYVCRMSDARRILERKVLHKERVVGFDCRYKTSLRPANNNRNKNINNDFDDRIAVITLATATKVYIFHLSSYSENENNKKNENNNKNDNKDNDDMESDNELENAYNQERFLNNMYYDFGFESLQRNGSNLICNQMRYILESNQFIKVGCNIYADFLKLSKDFDIQFDQKSLLDLANFYKLKQKKYLKIQCHNNNDNNNSNRMNNDNYNKYNNNRNNKNYGFNDLHFEIFGSNFEFHSNNDDFNPNIIDWTQYPLNDQIQRYLSTIAHLNLKIFFAIYKINQFYVIIPQLQQMEQMKAIQDMENIIDESKEAEYDLKELIKQFSLKDILNDQNGFYLLSHLSDSSKIDEWVRLDQVLHLLEKFDKCIKENNILHPILSHYWQWSFLEFVCPNIENINNIRYKNSAFINFCHSHKNNNNIAYFDFCEFDYDVSSLLQISHNKTNNNNNMNENFHEMMEYYHFSNFSKYQLQYEMYYVCSTGNIPCLKRESYIIYEIYTLFKQFHLSFDMICNNMSQSKIKMTINKIENSLSFIIDNGYDYNFKSILNSIIKFNNKCDMNHTSQISNVFNFKCLIFILKIWHFLSIQLKNIFEQFPNLQTNLINFYKENQFLNPSNISNNNYKNKKYNNNNKKFVMQQQKEFETKLKQLKEIYESIFLLIKLKDIKENLNIFYDSKATNKKYLKNEQLIRWTLIKLVILHAKRVIWNKHAKMCASALV